MLELPQVPKGFYRHRLHRSAVKVIGYAANKEAGMVVLYHPLNPEAPVYRAGKLFDWKRPDEFTASYELITAREQVESHEHTYHHLYPEYAVYFV